MPGSPESPRCRPCPLRRRSAGGFERARPQGDYTEPIPRMQGQIATDVLDSYGLNFRHLLFDGDRPAEEEKIGGELAASRPGGVAAGLLGGGDAGDCSIQ